jgi:hypothetical protein
MNPAPPVMRTDVGKESKLRVVGGGAVNQRRLPPRRAGAARLIVTDAVTRRGGSLRQAMLPCDGARLRGRLLTGTRAPTWVKRRRNAVHRLLDGWDHRQALGVEATWPSRFALSHRVVGSETFCPASASVMASATSTRVGCYSRALLIGASTAPKSTAFSQPRFGSTRRPTWLTRP